MSEVTTSTKGNQPLIKLITLGIVVPKFKTQLNPVVNLEDQHLVASGCGLVFYLDSPVTDINVAMMSS